MYLTSKELAHRWRISVQTLANWRSAGDKGPPFVKVGGKPLYSVAAVEAYEKQNSITPQSHSIHLHSEHDC